MSALDDAALDRLWDAAAARLQRNGLAPRGVLELHALTRDERFALTGLLGRRVGQRARIDMAALDARLREAGAAAGLVAAVSARRGPLVDRPGVRAATAAARGEVWAAARDGLAEAGLAGESWVEPWLDTIRPALGRVPAATARTTVITAVRAMARLPWEGVPRGRSELAAAVAGSAHALDDGTLLGAVVLRAVALRVGLEPAESAAERRRLWAVAGVLTDEVSTTVPTLGLRPLGGSAAAVAVATRTDAGCESHLTLRDLARCDRLIEADTTVWVCENPRVLEAAMDAGARAVVVCTAGNPTVVVTSLLARLAADGGALRYHGDFDWPGVAIANRVIGACGAQPWRMAASDYVDAVGAMGGAGLALAGRRVDPVWDSALGEAMAGLGIAVHEEAVLDLLVGDVALSSRTTRTA